MTIKAFLRKIMTEREKAQKKLAMEKAAAAPTPDPKPELADRSASAAPDAAPASSATDADGKAQESADGSSTQHPQDPASHPLPTEAQKDVAQPSIEVSVSIKIEFGDINVGQATEDMVREESFQEHARAEDAAQGQESSKQDDAQQLSNGQGSQSQVTNGQWPMGGGMGPGMNSSGYGFEGMNQGFPGMPFNNTGDFSSMMQFMPNNAMGAFPNMMGMPGMPGMGLDAMQAMYGGFGGSGVGMTGMNAGMGFPGGQGWNGGFNGQPGGWMSGQDKYNQNAYGGQANGMGGDFGGNAGYAGYNMPSHQGNFNQMNHHQFPNNDFQSGYHGQGYSNRGRGRGRGYSYASRGRGGYDQVMATNQTNHDSFHHEKPPQDSHQEGSHSQYTQHQDEAVKDANSESDTKQNENTSEQLAKEFAPGDADEGPIDPATTALEETPITQYQNGDADQSSKSDAAPPVSAADAELEHHPDPPGQNQQEKPAPIQTFVPDEQTQADSAHPASASSMMPPPSPAVVQPTPYSSVVDSSYDYSTRGRGSGRGFSRPATDFRGAGRGRGAPGYLPNGNSSHGLTGSVSTPAAAAAPIVPLGTGVEGAPTGPKAMREGLPNTGVRGGRGFSIVGRASIASQGRQNAALPLAHALLLNIAHGTIVLTITARQAHLPALTVSLVANDATEDLGNTRMKMKKWKTPLEHHHADQVTEADEITVTIVIMMRGGKAIADLIVRGVTGAKMASPTPTDGEFKIVDTAAQPSSTSSSRKRRERDDDEESRVERKRSRREHHADTVSNHHYSEKTSSGHRHRHSEAEKQAPSTIKPPSGPKGYQPPPKEMAIDPHELERQARNKERMQKELQRREAMEGKGHSRKESGGHKGGGGGLGRRVSYKYEDELEGQDGERERERGRWGR
ncbi:MAG: hypothetical protein Q9174_003735 [Haloplaca sp. 1 TL-2023]